VSRNFPRRGSGLQFEAKPSAPDPVYAVKLQELLGGAYGEMTVAMQYLFQGWNCRMPGKYKDLILDVGTEELAHVEMISIMIARLLEGAPAETTAKACTDNPVLAAVVGGMNPAQAIVSGGGPLLADSSGAGLERQVHHCQRQPVRRLPRQRHRRDAGHPAVQHDRRPRRARDALVQHRP
jgi:Mn-containing catalase